jgi:glycosyltransferase involved in cell wall biosynthesis
VLHVLPHPGGGGESYVDALSGMPGYGFERLYLSAARSDGRTAAAAGVASAGWSALRRARGHDLLHVHGEVAAAVCLPALVASRSVATMHGLHLLRRAGGITRIAATANLRLVTRAATRTICVSEAERLELAALLGRTAVGRLRVIRNGVPDAPSVTPAERAAARRELRLDDATVAAAFVGGLDPHKDPLAAARSAIQVASTGVPIALLVAGEGPLAYDLEGLRAGASADVLRLLGPRTDVRTVLAAADFFVLPSLREGLSFALLEAMAVGLPPVVSDAPGNPEAVGDAGVVVRRGDAGGLADAFQRLAADPAGRRALGARARERVRREFRADAMVEATRRLYDEALGARRG